MKKLKAIWYFIIWGIPEIWKLNWHAIKSAWVAAKVIGRLK